MNSDYLRKVMIMKEEKQSELDKLYNIRVIPRVKRKLKRKVAVKRK